MSTLYSYLLSPGAVVFLMNLVIASCLAAGLGLLAVRVCRNRPASLRHGLLLTTMVLLAASPILLAVAAWRGWPAVTLSVSQAKGDNAGTLTENKAEASFPVAASSNPVVSPVGASGENRPVAAQMLWRIAGTVAACIWASGIVARSVRLLRRLRVLRRFQQSLEPARKVHLGTNECPGREVWVYDSPFTPIPLTVGLLRPVLVLPEGLADELTAEQLRMVVRHEDAHVCRRDHWAALLQWATVTLFWWNPMVHAVSNRLSRLREQLCDDHAARSAREGRLLAEALLRVAERTILAAQFPCVALFDGDTCDLEERVRRLLAPTRWSDRLGFSGQALIGSFAVLASGLLLVAGLRATAPAPPSTRDGSTAETPGRATLRASSEEVLPVDRVAADQRLIPPPDTFAGRWVMTLPRGFRHRITLTPVGEGCYRFEPRNLMMSGVYAVQNERLVIIAPSDKRLAGFVWQKEVDGTLTLIGEPGVAKTGSSYLEATMRRLAN